MTAGKSSITLFKSRIRLAVALLMAAVIAISTWHALSERHDIIATAERQSAGYARALAEHSESALAESDRILQDVLHDLRLKGGVAQYDRLELFRDLQREVGSSPQIGSLFLVDKSGEMFLNSIEFPAKQINVADREYFRYYLTTPGADLTLGRPVMSRLVNRWRFNLMRPLNEPGATFSGLITVAFEVEYFKKFFTAASLGPRGRIALIHTAGIPLVFEPYVDKIYESDFRTTALFREKLPSAPSGTYHHSDEVIKTDNTNRIVSYQRLSRFPVVAVVSLDRDDVLAPWKNKLFLQSGLTLGLCLCLIFLLQMLLRYLDQLQASQSTLSEQQEQLRIKAAQIDAAHDGIIMVDDQGRLLHANNAFCRLTGYGQDELQGKRLHDFNPAGEAAGTDANITMILEQGEATFESAYVTKAGVLLPVEASARTMESGGKPFIISVVRNISERRRSERREQTRSRILEDLTSDIDLTDLLTHIIRFVEQELEGASCSILLADEDGLHLRHGAAPSLPEAYNRAVDGLRIAQGMGSCGTAAHTRQRVIVEEIEGHPYWKGFRAAREAGLHSCWSEPLTSTEGKLLGTFSVYHREPHSPQQSELQLIESACQLASIAIERFQTVEQKKHLESQLHHAQRIESVGQLAGGIAHDFNNLLTPIIVYADMIKNKLPAGDPLAAKTDGIISAAGKARDLTRQLLSFGRKQMLKLQSVDLNEIIATFHDIMRRTIRENIALYVQPAPGNVQIMADRGQIEQILLNLAVNAQDAISGNGSIVMETGHVVLDNEYARQHPGMRPGSYALLAFIDSGSGMSDDILCHIFEPFFTTKQVGHGTGLGLATVYGIVKQHDGYITASSRVGEGTTFSIYLPLSNESSAALPESPPQQPASAALPGKSTILVVEDNDMVRSMVVELLESSGYRVLEAMLPSVAERLVAKHGKSIDLMISDVVMPEMSGPELYELLSESLPDLPVLYMSGYTNELFAHHGTLEEGVNFLQKPFTAERFLERVRQALARASGS